MILYIENKLFCNTILLRLLDNKFQSRYTMNKLNHSTMKKTAKGIDEFRQEATEAFLAYQACKYDLKKIAPLSKGYFPLSFKDENCYIGEIKLEETSYVCDAIVPNFEIPNVILEAEQILEGSRFTWRVTLKINFFGLCLCVYHTSQKHLYYVGIPNNFDPVFRIIAKEDNPKIKRMDNMICSY